MKNKIGKNMNKIYITLLFMLSSILVYPQTNGLNDSVKSNKTATYTPTYIDTNDDGLTVESTTEDEDSVDIKSYNKSSYTFDSGNLGLDFSNEIDKAASMGIAFVIIIFFMIFSFPLLVILLVFYFRNRNRRDSFLFFEKVIASGQLIPNELLIENMKSDTDTNGIKEMCTGVGLFIFLWAITNNLGVACIGVLVFCTGLGKFLVSRKKSKKDNSHNNE